jgi:uncharacterized protein YndB with AHSA1/START domain
MEPLRVEFTVACDAARAFSLWAEQTTRWWPHGHSVSAERGLTVTFEPRPGGRIYERTRDGTEHDWGEVLVWEPPHRLVYLWHLRFDRSDATEVEVTFTPQRTGPRCGSSIAGGSGSAPSPRRGGTATAAAGPA